MDDAKVAALRKWVVAICAITPVLFLGLGFWGYKSFVEYEDREEVDDATYRRELRTVLALLIADAPAERKLTIHRMRAEPRKASLWLEYLAFAEKKRLERIRDSERTVEAQTALETQLEAIKILEHQARPNVLISVVGNPRIELAWEDLAHIAIVGKGTDILRSRASEWTKMGNRGPVSDDGRAHLGYQLLGWADLIDGKSEEATQNFLKSGDHMNSSFLKSNGPSTKLADALLDRGRLEEVALWLEKVGKSWKSGATEIWVSELKAGRRPTDKNWRKQSRNY